MARVNRFQRQPQGGGTYRCHMCTKLTRETGDDESSVDLCRKCYRTCVRENHHSDNCHDDKTPPDQCGQCRADGLTDEWVNA